MSPASPASAAACGKLTITEMPSTNYPNRSPRAGTAVQARGRAASDVATAADGEEVIATLRSSGCSSVADRLDYLRTLVAEDPEETPIAVESLRRLALFIMDQRRLPDPEIGVSPEGFAQAEWRVGDDGLLAMEFLPADVIRFAAISHPAGIGTQRVSVNGVLPTADTLDAVRVFTDRLTSQ